MQEMWRGLLNQFRARDLLENKRVTGRCDIFVHLFIFLFIFMFINIFTYIAAGDVAWRFDANSRQRSTREQACHGQVLYLLYICMYTYEYMCKHTCIYICICIYIYIHIYMACWGNFAYGICLRMSVSRAGDIYICTYVPMYTYIYIC